MRINLERPSTMVKQRNVGRNVLGDITNHRPNESSENPGKENLPPKRTPLADITNNFDKQQSKTKRLSDEEKMHYLLLYYSLPLIKGKMKPISKFLREHHIEKNSDTFRREWKESGLMSSRIRKESFAQARSTYIQWIEKQKAMIAERNKRNWYSTQASKKNDTDGHCNKMKSDENRKEESSDNEIGKDIIVACLHITNVGSSF